MKFRSVLQGLRFQTLGNALPVFSRFTFSMISMIGALVLAVSLAGNEGHCAGVGDPGATLPADGIFPRGRKLAFMGYSGDPERDLANGFTAAGPVYGDQTSYLNRCFEMGWPVVAYVGLSREGALGRSTLVKEIEEQVRALAGHKEIFWWAIRPEELRPWDPGDMNYLATVTEIIQRSDPLGRPIYLYNPSHLDRSWLGQVAKYVDIVAKGSYVNRTGHKRDRAWLRWSVEQELAAIASYGRPNAAALVVPELCQDPEPAEDAEIRSWVRHDVYLGLVCGAKGVLIWSLFKRPEVARTWKLWYEAYSECAKELNGERGLAPIFLFGKRCKDLNVRAEPQAEAGSWTSAELAYGESRWLFLVNSANGEATFTLSGWPDGSRAEDAFSGKPVALEARASLTVVVPAYGVLAFRFHKVIEGQGG